MRPGSPWGDIGPVVRPPLSPLSGRVAQASRTATDSTARPVSAQLATAYTQGGAQLQGYASQSAALASKRFKASLNVAGSVFMLTQSPDGNGNVLLQVDKDSG